MTRLERIRRVAGREDGLTLVEMLVAMVFIAILFTAFSALASTTMTQSTYINKNSVLQKQVRSAVNEMLTEIREAYPPTPSSTSAFVPATLTQNQLELYAPDMTYSSGNPTTFYLREINYQVSNGTLSRQVALSTTTGTPATTSWAYGAWGPSVPEISGITNTNGNIFTYYTDDNPPLVTTNPALASTVVVTLTVSNAHSSAGTFTYSDSATLRVAP